MNRELCTLSRGPPFLSFRFFRIAFSLVHPVAGKCSPHRCSSLRLASVSSELPFAYTSHTRVNPLCCHVLPQNEGRSAKLKGKRREKKRRETAMRTYIYTHTSKSLCRRHCLDSIPPHPRCPARFLFLLPFPPPFALRPHAPVCVCVRRFFTEGQLFCDFFFY